MEEQQKTQELENQAWGDSTGQGLAAGLDAFFEQGEVAPIKKEEVVVVPPTEVASVKEEEAAKVVETEAATKLEAVKEEEETEEKIMDEEFFSDKEESEVKKDFDEKDFDKETEDAAKGMETKAGDKFKELRTELKEYKKAKTEAVIPEETAKRIQELEVKAAEADGLRVRLEEATSKSAELQVQNSDEYDREILKPVSEIFKKSDQIAETYQIDPQVLRTIIKEENEVKRNELVEEYLGKMPPYNQARIITFADEFNNILGKRDEMLQKADEKITVQQAKSIEEANRTLTEQRLATQTIQKDIFEKYKDKIPGFLEDGKETSKFKELLSRSLSIDFQTAKARDQAFAAFSGTVLPHAVQEIASLRKKLLAYEADDEKTNRHSASPSKSLVASKAAEKKDEGFVKGFLEANFA